MTEEDRLRTKLVKEYGRNAVLTRELIEVCGSLNSARDDARNAREACQLALRDREVLEDELAGVKIELGHALAQLNTLRQPRGADTFTRDIHHLVSVQERDRQALAQRRPGLRGIHQTVYGTSAPWTDDNPPGNCTQAAVATLLGLELDDVPHFVELTLGDPRPGAWWEVFRTWSVDRFGIGWVSLEPDDARLIAWEVDPTEMLILGGGTTPRGHKHSVVIDGNLELVWDPNPGGNGLTALTDVDVPIEPDPFKLDDASGEPMYRVLCLTRLDVLERLA